MYPFSLKASFTFSVTEKSREYWISEGKPQPRAMVSFRWGRGSDTNSPRFSHCLHNSVPRKPRTPRENLACNFRFVSPLDAPTTQQQPEKGKSAQEERESETDRHTHTHTHKQTERQRETETQRELVHKYSLASTLLSFCFRNRESQMTEPRVQLCTSKLKTDALCQKGT